MIKDKAKFISELFVGIFCGALLGLFGFGTLATYGGNHGCWPLIDFLFNGVGYESCGSFGAFAGIITGSLVGVILLYRAAFQKKTYGMISLGVILSIVIIPFILGTLIPVDESSSILFWGVIVLIGGLFSLIPTLITIFLVHRRQILK